jgi:hypothetical protein
MAIPCSKSLISQVERGAKPATPWLVGAVARALHIDVPQLLGQPYRGTTERTDRVHASIPQIRIAMTYWDVPPTLDAAPRPLDAIRQDVNAVGSFLDKVDYLRLGERLPGLVEELSAILHGSDGTTRREAAELLIYAYVERSSHHYIDVARAQLVAGQPQLALDSLVKADHLAPQHTRNHPMARETVAGLIRVHNRLPESLRSMARRMGVSVTAS